MFAAVCVFNVSMHMCTIKNIMAEGFNVFSEGSTNDLSVSIDGMLVALQLY